MIAFLSTGYGLSRKARKLYPLEQDEQKRARYMRKAIKQKFDKNPKLKELLLQTGDKEIIEYTFRDDTFFWISQDTLKGKNVLGKLLMEYRNKAKI
jgi:N-glycosidase YbiA